ncbi:MAG: ferrous iron transport protein A [Proteobacteria bacterium]|nr:ferrous iron transport protein A [Pseudomonadota bacterium]
MSKDQILTSLPPLERGYVESINGSNASISRMASMGISQGVGIIMIRNHKRAPVIIEVRDTLIALGRLEAAKIFVKRVQV